jgi:hypothetical protein
MKLLMRLPRPSAINQKTKCSEVNINPHYVTHEQINFYNPADLDNDLYDKYTKPALPVTSEQLEIYCKK